MEKEILKKIQQELKNIFNEWDFLGVSVGSKDEYDCLIPPLIKLLFKSPSKSEVCNFIVNEADKHFGAVIAENEAALTADRIMNWWDKENFKIV